MAHGHDKDIYKRPYNRPNEHWVCGRAAEGHPCPLGPTRRGHCAARHECVPALVGERWVCTRPEQYGGPCDSPAQAEPAFGPYVRDGVGVCCKEVHCTPQRSMRALRGRASVVLCVALIGVVLTGLGGAWRNSFLSPGPLTLSHQGASMASLEAMEHGTLAAAGHSGGESCHICHTGLDGGLEGLVKSAFMREAPVSQSSQCLTCHQEDVGDHAMLAHALPGDLLAARTEAAQAESFSAPKPLSLALAALSPGVKTGGAGELACAACHREHNGTFFDLKRMDNVSCQTCHVKQFNDLTVGHPEFATRSGGDGYDFPYRRRTRIIYDHERHETNYYQREEYLAHVPADCTSCHEVGGESYTTRLKSFEAMCAACHTGNIVSSRDEWIHVFGIPSLEFDVYDMLESELELPPVPRTAAKSMSPFMMLLLAGFSAGDPEAQATFAQDLAMVQEFEGDLSGIAYDEDPEIVGRLFSGMAELRTAAMDGEGGGFRQILLDLLENVGGAPVAPRDLDAMFGFPRPGSTVDQVIADVGRKDIVEMSGWHVAESGFRVDPASWGVALDAVEAYQSLKAEGGGTHAKALSLIENFRDFRAWFDEHFRVAGGDWILRARDSAANGSDWEALARPLLGAGGGVEEAAPEEGDAEEADGHGAEPAGDDVAETPPAAGPDADAAFAEWFGNFATFKKWMEDTADISGEFWTLRAPRSLYYRPIQHADPFTVAWLDFTASLYAKNPAAALVFDGLSGRATGSAIGSCMKCHSLDVEKDYGGTPVVKVNWTSEQPQRDFTKFKHAPHLKLMNCAECHSAPWVPAVSERLSVARAASAEEESPDDAAATENGTAAPAVTALNYLDSFKASTDSLELGVNFSHDTSMPDSHGFVSNFEPITKNDCARCHVEGKAGDSCLLCHNYHIQAQNRPMGVQSLRELIVAKASTALAPEDAAQASPEVAPEDGAEDAPEEGAE